MFPFFLISTSLPVICTFFNGYTGSALKSKQNKGVGKEWGGGGGGSGHVLDVPNGAEGEGLKYIALKHLVFT